MWSPQEDVNQENAPLPQRRVKPHRAEATLSSALRLSIENTCKTSEPGCAQLCHSGPRDRGLLPLPIGSKTAQPLPGAVRSRSCLDSRREQILPATSGSHVENLEHLQPCLQYPSGTQPKARVFSLELWVAEGPALHSATVTPRSAASGEVALACQRCPPAGDLLASRVPTLLRGPDAA